LAAFSDKGFPFILSRFAEAPRNISRQLHLTAANKKAAGTFVPTAFTPSISFRGISALSAELFN
jgi:hypothetical protein